MIISKTCAGEQEAPMAFRAKETSFTTSIPKHRASTNFLEIVIIYRVSSLRLGSSGIGFNSYDIGTAIGTDAYIDSLADFNALGYTEIAKPSYPTQALLFASSYKALEGLL